MAVKIHYESRNGLIIVQAKICSHVSSLDLNMLFDTGCSHTLVRPEVVDLLGIRQRDFGRKTIIQTALSREAGQMFTAKEFALFGRKFVGVEIDCHTLPDYFEIDGLIGMDMLSKFCFKVDPRKKSIELSPVL